MCSPKSFIVLTLTLLLRLELTLYVVWIKGPRTFFCKWITSYPGTTAEETFLASLNGYGTLVKNNLNIDMLTKIHIVKAMVFQWSSVVAREEP